MIDDTSSTAETTIENKLNAGLSSLNKKYTIIQSQKVGETISRDLRNNALRSEEHTSELQSHSFISYAVFCLKKKNRHTNDISSNDTS